MSRMRSLCGTLMLLSSLYLSLTISPVQSEGDAFKPQPFRSGPWVHSTVGEIWPNPQIRFRQNSYFIIDPSRFQFKLNLAASQNEIISASMDRFVRRMFPGYSGYDRNKRESKVNGRDLFQPPLRGQESTRFSYNVGPLTGIAVILDTACGNCETFPHMGMNETYEIVLNPDAPEEKFVIATSVWGLLRGLESLSQMVYISQDDKYNYQINATRVIDFPRFPHRGFMLDTARHYLSMNVLLQTLDLMEINKFNVFHWHIVDTEAFPYQSRTFPNLSEAGAYDRFTHVYTQEHVQTIIEAARIRGIRVLAEFDTPGHTQSWEKGQPGLLTECYDSLRNKPDGNFGPMDPTKESVFVFLEQLYQEISEVFPEKYVHIGGDEVSFKCWRTNPLINDFMDQWNITGNYKRLESYFIERVLNIVEGLPTKNIPVVWQEVFDNGDFISKDTVVQVWKNWGVGWKNRLQAVTEAGQPALLSAPYYLNYIKYGSDWIEMYEADPHDYSGSSVAKELVLGGEACIWVEFVNSINLIPRAWPRASAVAERLWSSQDTNKVEEAAPRLQEHECRMLGRGYPVAPIVGAGFCHVTWN
eukprot:maker-scaffold122_size333723-snap-gene-2.35 protein:Tk04123 transcript:maker-scaffold122_size333723-snap-gene-2.35-mRNA-1 annotation:"beta-hexosaminidase subunit alpha-like"